MFDFLKKKISGFIDGIARKGEEKAEAAPPAGKSPEESVAEIPEEQRVEEKPAPVNAQSKEAPKSVVKKPERKAAEPETKKPEPAAIEPQRQKPAAETKPTPAAKPAPKPETPIETPAIPEPAPAKEKGMPPKSEPARPAPKAAPEPKRPARAPAQESPIAPQKTPDAITANAPPAPQPFAPEPIAAKPEPKDEKEKPKERLKLGIVGAVKSLITREVEISEKDVSEMVESLELELLEADVDIGVSEGIKEELMGRLVGSKVARDKLHSFVSGSIRETLVDILTNEKDFDIVSRVESGEKPVKIMFIGINGAGKTTTIAKVAKLLMDSHRKVVFAAADTFRAAAIEQMGVHAERLNVKMIAREYGSDPTSVAYDAVNYAKAHGIDAVLIDTAGRQDTNISLLNEMKKMKRVISPDICIYIGESIAGNAIIEQITAFNREVGVDAVILSKLDCDPKGGTMLSISKATGVPIIYVGIGQGYDALERFDPQRIVSRIVE
ncbi:signal recognition particle-docking protein FtsY [Candidatus Micrarchaeota archaeon]|nr:signal recognition particle-docking protein FtsY [Candidatus Micrarchaeota archaeon]